MKIPKKIEAAFKQAERAGKPLGVDTLSKVTKLAMSDDNKFSAEEKAAISNGWAAFTGGAGPGATQEAAAFFGMLQRTYGFEAGAPSDGPASSLKLPTELSAYGSAIQKLGAPPFLSSPKFELKNVIGGVAPFGSANLGGGFLITNRHVYEGPLEAKNHPGAFVGKEALRYDGADVSLRMLPDLGSYNSDFGRVNGDFATFKDFALLERKDFAGNEGPPLRKTADVQKGEPLWVIGDAAVNGKLEISAGTFSGTLGGSAVISGMDLESGFSGNPVLDKEGRMVGLLFGGGKKDGQPYGLMVRTETLVDAIAKAREKDPSLPQLTFDA